MNYNEPYADGHEKECQENKNASYKKNGKGEGRMVVISKV